MGSNECARADIHIFSNSSKWIKRKKRWTDHAIFFFFIEVPVMQRLWIAKSQAAGQGWAYFLMERESTAEMVSRMHPDSPLSNCVKVSRSEKMPLTKVVHAGEADGWCWGGAHLLSVLLQEQQQLTEVVESEARHLGQNRFSVQITSSNNSSKPWISSLRNTCMQTTPNPLGSCCYYYASVQPCTFSRTPSDL